MPDPSDHRSSVQSASPRTLAKVLDVADGAAPEWSNPDLKDYWQHELGSPVQFDLTRYNPEFRQRVSAMSSSDGLLIKSLRDVLLHPHPPLELLRLVKDFAKANLTHDRSQIPKPVSLLLYYLSLSAALCGHQQSISQMKPFELAAGLRWALGQAWLDDASRQLIARGLASIEPTQEAPIDIA